MIKCEKGNVMVSGIVIELKADLTMILISVREAFEEKMGKEKAADEIRDCIKLSFTPEKEIEDEINFLAAALRKELGV